MGDKGFWKVMIFINFPAALLFDSVANLILALIALTIFHIMHYYDEKKEVDSLEQEATPKDKRVINNIKLQKQMLVETGELLAKYSSEIKNNLPKSLDYIEKDYGRLYRLATVIGMIHGNVIQFGFPMLKSSGIIDVIDEAISSMDKIKYHHSTFIEFIDLLLRFKEIIKLQDNLIESTTLIMDPVSKDIMINYSKNDFLHEQCLAINSEYMRINNKFLEGFTEWLSQYKEDIDEERKHYRANVTESNTNEKMDS